MKNIYKSEILTATALVFILLLTLYPSRKLLMPMGLEMMIPIAMIIIFLFYAAVFWKEDVQDERDNLHRLSAGRVSFLVGSSVLAVGIFFQSLSHNIDPWLIFALISMVFAKTVSRIYDSIKK